MLLTCSGMKRARPLWSWTRSGTFLGQPPTGEQVEMSAIVIFRVEDGKLAERWAGWKR